LQRQWNLLKVYWCLLLLTEHECKSLHLLTERECRTKKPWGHEPRCCWLEVENWGFFHVDAPPSGKITSPYLICSQLSVVFPSDFCPSGVVSLLVKQIILKHIYTSVIILRDLWRLSLKLSSVIKQITMMVKCQLFLKVPLGNFQFLVFQYSILLHYKIGVGLVSFFQSSSVLSVFDG